MLKKLTPVLMIESIDASLPFWTERLGFTKTIEVPHGDGLGFVALVRDKVEVMLQARASAAEHDPAIAADDYRSALYIEVESLDPLESALEGADVLFARRKTFYGSTETAVRDPDGNVLTFAVFGGE